MYLKCVCAAQQLTVGANYDVSEILEFPLHCMVRLESEAWPRPGDPLFGLHPDEFFASPKDGLLDIRSCGYTWYCHAFFGICVSNQMSSENAQLRDFCQRVCSFDEEIQADIGCLDLEGTLCVSHRFLLGYEMPAIVKANNDLRSLEKEITQILKRLDTALAPKLWHYDYWKANGRDPARGLVW
jgi:hypothetical protein